MPHEIENRTIAQRMRVSSFGNNNFGRGINAYDQPTMNRYSNNSANTFGDGGRKIVKNQLALTNNLNCSEYSTKRSTMGRLRNMTRFEYRHAR